MHFQGKVNCYIQFKCQHNFLNPRITTKWLRDHCRKHGLYQTPHLNEVLYLQHQGFKCIELLEDYTGLRSLWLDHNRLTNVLGLNTMKNLKCLFIQNNYLVTLSGIEFLSQLVILDVSNNELKKINEIVVRNLDSYRFQITIYCKNLKFLDEKPIQENDRFCAKARLKNGIFGMRKEKTRQKDVEDLETIVYVLGKSVTSTHNKY
uniref:Dynein assembly factor 1, axonemal homolog n=1 Tax=Daphnia galeata TaxID=27404 RepID=A0A8J2RA85_9CRUS|nr:unnamed protein product [Daphnia galeata]